MRTLFLRSAAVFLVGGLAAVLLAAGGSNPPASAGKKPPKARIADFAVDVEEQQVLVSFRLEDAFDEDLRRRLDSGLATGIVYDFALVRKRPLWFNKTVARGKLQVSAMYNAVSREYLVNYKHDGALIDSRVVREADELYAAMSRFERLAVLSLAGRKGELTVKVRAELGTGSLLFFIPTLRTTDWEERKIEVDANGRLEAEGE